MHELLSADNISQLLTIAATVCGTAWGSIKWFGGRVLSQHDALVRRMDALERDYVTRKELADLRDELQRNNQIQINRLDQIWHLLASKADKSS
jgi:hypothetical protein